MPEFLTALTTAHTNPASKFHLLTFQTNHPEFHFQPGQHILLKVAEAKINQYSIANAPRGNRIELIVDISPNRQGSQYIQNLQIGDEIRFLGPFGKFVLQPEEQVKHRLFLATGSGIAPLKPMIEELIRKGDKTPMSLYFGLRYPEDIFLKDYFDRPSHQNPHFHFYLSLSKPDEKWSGEIGHITDLVKRDFSSTSDFSVYLCGTEQMILSATELLKTLGTPENRIYYEKFF